MCCEDFVKGSADFDLLADTQLGRERLKAESKALK